MKIDHALLLSALEICKPALATASNRAIELTHFWFDGGFVSAYNGRLGIMHPFDTPDIRGGVPPTLFSWLELSKSPDAVAELTTRGKELIVTVGSSHATFAMLEASKQILQPSLDLIDGDGVELDKTLIEGLTNILVSLDPKSATPARMGAFFVPAYGFLDIYATDDNTVSWLKVKLPDNYRLESHIVIPTGFIEQLLKMLPEGGKDALFVHDHAVVAINPNGVMVIGNLVDCPTIPDFTDILARYEKNNPDEIPIPEALSGAINRVLLVPNKATEFSVENNTLYIISDTKGTTRFEEAMPVTHPNVIEFFDPELLKRALPERTSIHIEKGKLCMKGPAGFVHLIAASNR